MVTTTAYDVAATVKDPELPMLTISDLGILRDVRQDGDHVTVEITPTYSGCPAMGAIRADVTQQLNDAGYHDVDVRTVLQPAWTTDWISEDGKRTLARAGRVLDPVGRPAHLGASATGQ